MFIVREVKHWSRFPGEAGESKFQRPTGKEHYTDLLGPGMTEDLAG